MPAGLELGIAAHHAGMVPPFKEAVEACFAEGLVKAVFATETLALGVNMPARSVVIERLTKFTGERHELLTPGEYTQLTGRAGRRGIDDVGYAIVLWSPFVPFEQVASLASSRTYALRSAFRPTYNMAANLVRRYQPEEAHHLLNLSFAQYQADRGGGAPRGAPRAPGGPPRALSAEARCERGDVDEYRAPARPEATTADGRPGGRRARRATAPSPPSRRLVPGDVVVLDGDRSGGAQRGLPQGPPRLHVVDERGKPRIVGADDLAEPPRAVGTIELPVPYNPQQPRLPAPGGRGPAPGPPHAARGGGRGRARPRRRGARRRRGPSRGRLPRPRRPPAGAVQAERVARELDDLRRQVQGRTESLARRFDRVLRLLEAWGYLDGWALTARARSSPAPTTRPTCWSPRP